MTAVIWMGLGFSKTTTSAFLLWAIFLRIFLKGIFVLICSTLFEDKTGISFFTLDTMADLLRFKLKIVILARG